MLARLLTSNVQLALGESKSKVSGRVTPAARSRRYKYRYTVLNYLVYCYYTRPTILTPFYVAIISALNTYCRRINAEN